MNVRSAIATALLAGIGLTTSAGADDDSQQLLPTGLSLSSISSTLPFDATFSTNPVSKRGQAPRSLGASPLLETASSRRHEPLRDLGHVAGLTISLGRTA
jgi:hypothetical protein